MKLSDTIAGVTLLAFGNGAPDVFSSILAATRMEIGLSIGGLLGGSIFVTMIVLGRVVLVSGECKIDTNKTIRDCVLLIITVMLILIYGLIGVITLFQACLFPLLYVFYVFSVFQMEKKTQKLLENSFEMPILERNYVNWVDIIDDYIETNPKKLETQPYLKKDEFQWSSIKQSLYEEKK
jgi:Ca2+/Na+ antiporter